MKETITQTLPSAEYVDNLKDYQNEYLHAHPRFRVIMWHRGSHKTTDLLNFSLTQCYEKRGLYWFLGPKLNQTILTTWIDPNTNIFRWIPEDIRKKLKVNNSDHSITFPNGSVWMIKGADDPDSLRGPKPVGISVDEYGEIANRWGAKLREEILEPSIHSSNGWIDYGGTPKGNNDFQYIYTLGQDPTQPDWWSSKKTVDDTDIYTEDEMKQIVRNAVRPEIVDQEYYCKVIDGALTVFKGHAKCCKGKLEDPVEGHTYIFGIDLARTFDRTVIVGFNIHTNHLVYFKTIQNESWDSQKNKILDAVEKYNSPQVVIDATGVGDSFVEQLSHSYSNLYPFKISSNQIKRTLIERMAMFLENQYISYPDIEDIKDELNSYEYEVTPSNNITYNAPVGKHDDIVIAMALAVQLLNMTPIPFHPPSRMDEVREEMAIDEKTGYFR